MEQNPAKLLFSPSYLICGFLAAYRLTKLLFEEAGPFHVMQHLRSFLSRNKMFREMLNCPHCTGVWCAGITGMFYVLGLRYVPFAWIILVGAFSAISSLIYSVREYFDGH